MIDEERTQVISTGAEGPGDRGGFSLTRRSFLKTSIGGTISLAAVPAMARPGVGNRYASLQSSQYLSEVSIEKRLEGEQVFVEGPAVDKELNVYYTNIPAAQILKWHPDRKQLSVFREGSNRANGLLLDPEGRLLACEADRVTRTDVRTGRVEVLADRYRGVTVESANDLALDTKGRIYFTSRPSQFTPPKGSGIAVYRVDPNGEIDRILAEPRTQMPNGIVISPDDRLLYLIEAHPDERHFRHIRVYDLSSEGTVSNGRVLIDFYPRSER